jgi:hypothetical protein
MRNRGLAIAAVCIVLSVFFCPDASAEGRRMFSLGLNAGGGPVGASSLPTWRAGFETALRFGGRWALAANVSYGMMSVRTESSSGTYAASEDQTWADLPIALILRYEAPLSDSTIVSLGVGAGYHSFKRTVESETNAYGSPLSWSSESSFHAWAPLAEIGIEIALGKSSSLTGGIRYEFGVASQRSTVSGVNSVQEFGFGGASLNVGARFYLF